MYLLGTFVLSVFGVSCAFCGIITKECDNEGDLVLVSVIFRHGARTTYSFYPNDPHMNETFYPFGKGQLTNEGKLEEYKLGKYLKSLYGDFVGEDYTEEKVYVRSTDVTRTKMSAQLVLAGFFPPSQAMKWSDELLWLPIPVDYKKAEEEDIFHRSTNCPYKSNVLEALPNDMEARQRFIEPFESIYKYTSNNSGQSIEIPDDVQNFYFILKCEYDMNLTLPKWTDEIYPDSLDFAASYVYGYHNFDMGVKRINSGYMLKKILDDGAAKIDDIDSERRIFLYSGHESTIGYMMDALGIGEESVPPYGCALSFELRQLNSDYYVKLRYRKDAEVTVPVDLSIPGCDVMCPLDEFKQLVDDLIPTIPISEACTV